MKNMKLVTLSVVRFNMEDSVLNIAVNGDGAMDTVRSKMLDFVEKNKSSIIKPSVFVYGEDDEDSEHIDSSVFVHTGEEGMAIHSRLAEDRKQAVESFVNEIKSIKSMQDLPKVVFLDDGTDINTFEPINSYLKVSTSNLLVVDNP